MKFIFHVIICFFLVLTVGLVLVKKNINLLLSNQNSAQNISIYFKNELSNEEINLYIQKLQKTFNLPPQSIQLVDKKSAIQKFKNSFQEFAKDLENSDYLYDIIPIAAEVNIVDTSTKKLVLNYIQNSKDQIDEIFDHQVGLMSFQKIKKTFNSVLAFIFLISFVSCSFMIALLINNIVIKDQKKIEILTLFGESYSSIFKKYFINFGLYYLGTVLTSMTLLYSVYRLIEYVLNVSPHTQIIASKIQFIDMNQTLILLLAFTFVYFISLYTSLYKSIHSSLQLADS